MSRHDKSCKKSVLWLRLGIPWAVVVLLVLWIRGNQSVHPAPDFGLGVWEVPLQGHAPAATTELLGSPTCESPSEETALRVESPYWGFSDDSELRSLPQPETQSLPLADEPQDDATYWETLEGPHPLDFDAPDEQLLAEQLPKTDEIIAVPSAEELPEAEQPRTNGLLESPVGKLPAVAAQPPIRMEVPPTQNTRHMKLSAEELRLLVMIEHDALSISTGALTDTRLEERARGKISAACALSQRGASFAARQELIEVLRMVSQAKDKREITRLRSESLAAGLRALEEADDFLPRGTQLEADMDLEVICDSHRTPIGRELADTDILPAQMADRYNRYAQIKLALSVAGEPAGSMALYTLGKLNSQLAAQEPEHDRHCQRRALAFQQAALLAHNQNYLAAHELGVLLAESGHLREASHLFAQVAQRQPHAVVYRNLARVEEELGRHNEAQFCHAEAIRLASRGLGGPGQVAWVSPDEFARNAPPIPAPQTTPRPQVARVPGSQPYR